VHRRNVLKLALSAPLLASRQAWSQAKTLTLWYPAGDITAGAAHFTDKSFFAPYEAKTGVKVEAVGLDYDTMQQKIFAAAAAKNVGDILFVDGSWVPGFLKEDMLDAVPDGRAKAWLDAVSPEIRILSDYGKGRMWGYPQYGIDIYGLTWNKDHFKEAGLDPEKPPRTWDEFRDYAKKLTKRDAAGTITRVGYAIRHVGHPHGVVHKHFWALYGAGASLVDDPLALRGGKVNFNNEGGRAALKLVLDMLDVDKSTSLNFPDLKWGLAAPPVRKAGDKPVTLLGGWIYTVPKIAKNREAAWQLLEWINTPEQDYEMCKKYAATPRYKVNWDKEPFKSDAYDQALKQLYPYGKPLPINLGLNGVMDALGGAIQKTWHHEVKLEDALAEAERAANKAIADAAR